MGKVTSAIVNESEKKAYIAVSFTDGKSQILAQPMSDAEFDDYKAHADAYFGKIMPVGKTIVTAKGLVAGIVLVDRVYRFNNVLRRYAEGVDKFVRFARVRHVSDSQQSRS
jgi:hypothetical protein